MNASFAFCSAALRRKPMPLETARPEHGFTLIPKKCDEVVRRIVICATALVAFSASSAVADPCNPNAAQCRLREKIVFLNVPGGNTPGAIYMMNPDGTDPVRLTNSPFSGEALPMLSPDRKGRIVMDSNRIAINAGGGIFDSDLFLIKAHPNSDEAERPLTRGSSATWSPDSKSLAFHRSASGGYGIRIAGRPEPGGPTTDSDIFIMNLAVFLENLENPHNPQPGAEPINLTEGLRMLGDGLGPYASDDADWSPDVKWITFTSRPVPDPANPSSAGIGALYVMDLELRTPTRLTFSGVQERSPAWSPDGRRIAFMRRAPVSPTFEIWVIHLKFDAVTGRISEPPTVDRECRLTTNTVGDLGPSWSPSGSQIVFQKNAPPPGGGPIISQIWIMNLELDNSDCTKMKDETAITGPSAILPKPHTPIQGQNLFPNWGEIAVGNDRDSR